MAALATVSEAQARIVVRLHLQSTPVLTAEQELVVYRVAQEALTNVARHAGVTSVELRLEPIEHVSVLTVVDDGCGLAAGSLPSANGIRGMRERAMLIGASLTITSPDGRGTQVRLTIPHFPASRV